MGNTASSLGSLESERSTGSYDLTRGKKGYAVLVGSDWFMNAENPSDSSVFGSLSSMDKALCKTCHLETLAPYLSDTREGNRTVLVKENFDRLCSMHFDKDSVRSLARYSSYLYYYCGFGNETGMLTTDRQCIPYASIFHSVLQQAKSSGKPMIFVFDCHFYEYQVIDIKNIVKMFVDKIMGLELADTLVCFTFSAVGPDTCPPGVFTFELAHAIQQYSHLLSLTELIDLAGSRAKFKTRGILQGPLCVDYLTAQFMLVEEPSVKIFLEPEDWILYTCTQVDENFGISLTGELSPSSKLSSPGLGHYVLVIFSDDACGPHQTLGCVYSLANSLSSLGFQVFCDHFSRISPIADWVRWYSICSSFCDSIILICSPLMANSFSQPSSPSSAACVRVLTGINHQMASRSNPSLEIFPVLLSSQYNLSCVPSLFSDGKVYHIEEGHFSKAFDFSSLLNDYHSLIFGMSRMPHPTPPVGHVIQLPPENKPVNTVQLPSLATLQDIKDYFYKPIKQGYKVVTQVKPVPDHISLHYPHYATWDTPPTHHPPPPVPPPQHGQNPTVPQTITSDLLHKPVSIQAMLWLSGKVVQWKFLGRHLGVEEFELQRVEIENPQNISEQCFQTLNKWHTSEEANYRVLFEAVEFAEGRRLKDDFFNFVAKQQLQ